MNYIYNIYIYVLRVCIFVYVITYVYDMYVYMFMYNLCISMNIVYGGLFYTGYYHI